MEAEFKEKFGVQFSQEALENEARWAGNEIKLKEFEDKHGSIEGGSLKRYIQDIRFNHELDTRNIMFGF